MVRRIADGTRRRDVLKGIGTAGIAAGLAGCMGNDDDGNGNDNGGDESYYGVSGPFASEVFGVAWDGWDVPTVSGEFADETGIDVTAEYIGSDFEGFSRVQSGEDIDFIIPDNVWVQRLGEADLAQPIDEDQFADHLENIPEEIRDHPTMFHDDTRYGIPPRWGVQGLIYNKNEIPEDEVQTLAPLFDSAYENRISMWNIPLWSMGITALYLYGQGELSIDELSGEAIYGMSDDDLELVKQQLIDQRDLVRMFPETLAEARRPLIDEEVWVFNGFLLDYAQLKEIERELGTDKIGFQPMPDPGGIFWIEGMSITQQASDEATNAVEAFYSYALEPETQARLAWTDRRKSAPTNENAREFLTEDQVEILHLDQREEIMENTIDYMPSDPERWVEVWNEYKEA